LTCHKKSRLLFVLLNSSTTSGDCTLSRVCRENSHVVTVFHRLLLIRTVTCRQFPNLTFAPRNTYYYK